MGIILLVEDDLTLNKNIKMSLEMENYDVITASCLKEAGELYEKASLILLDVMLPDENGNDITLNDRKNDVYVPIDASKVALIDPKTKKTVKVGYKVTKEGKIRVIKKTGEKI